MSIEMPAGRAGDGVALEVPLGVLRPQFVQAVGAPAETSWAAVEFMASEKSNERSMAVIPPPPPLYGLVFSNQFNRVLSRCAPPIR